MKRSELLAFLSNRIASLDKAHPLRVGIDGVDASGKTRLADELVEPLQEMGRSVIRASIDGFHNPRKVRYGNGRYSPTGYFNDSFNWQAVRELLLQPLGPEGSLVYCCAIFDHRSDSPVESPLGVAAANAILLFDGIFIQRPELRDLLDFTIFLDVDFQVNVARLAARDGTNPDQDDPLVRRYVEGQRLYFETCQPQQRADMVIDNNDWANPVLVRGG